MFKAASIIVAVVSGWAIGSQALALTIAENGQAKAVIVVSTDVTPTQRYAADELARFLNQITGATFPIVNQLDPAKTNLLIGAKAATLADPSFSVEGLGAEGTVIRTVNNNLILAGGEPRGTLYAVYTFLEDQLGCRWWTPTASTIPHRSTISIDALNDRYVPVLESRETDAFSAMDGDWSARNKYNGQSHNLRADQGGRYYREPGFCHTFTTLINPGLYFGPHPEWFNEIKGQRTTVTPNYPTGSLCLTNEEMRHQLVENLKQSFRDAPAEADSSGLSEVRFYLPGKKTFVGDPGPGKGWDTSPCIKTSASSEHASRKAVKAVNGEGIDAKTGLLHGTDPDGTMFMSGTRRLSAASALHPGAVPGEHWIAFEFDKVYALGEMWIWNLNENRTHTMGARKVTIRYSATGGTEPSEWTTVFTGEIPEAVGLPDQPHQIAIDFAGAKAKCVVMTIHNNWALAGQSLIAEISQPDDSGPPCYCECGKCKAIEQEEGSAAGPLIRFLNAIAGDLEKDYPNVPISTLAYHYTQKPPKITKPRPELIIRLCDIHASFSKPLSDERNKEFSDDLVGWSKICQRLWIWDYVVNFSYPLTPHPNLRVLAPNIRYLVDHGVKGYFAEALPQSSGLEMAELRSWVLGKLMWNPKLDGDALVEEFVNGYYGPAGKPVMAYIKLMHDAVDKSGDYLGLGSPPDAKFLTLQNLCQGWQYLSQAEKAAGTDAALLKRVRVAQLPVMYVFLMRWDELSKQAKETNVRWPMPASVQALHKRIQTVAKQESINLNGVASPIPF